MNIFKKLINWIIHKLGGYTANIVESKNEAIRYYYGLYKTERENYLALLNCHNATAEAAQTALAPVEMAKTIKAYCKGMDYCENCDLTGESGFCKINGVPCYWEVDI